MNYINYKDLKNKLDNIHRILLEHNDLIDKNVTIEHEFKFKTEYSSFDYIVRIRSNSFDSISNLNLNSANEQHKLLEFFKSKSFQAAVVRTGAEGTGAYVKLIDIGEAYLIELNTVLHD